MTWDEEKEYNECYVRSVSVSDRTAEWRRDYLTTSKIWETDQLD